MAPPLLTPHLYKGAVAAACLSVMTWEFATAKPKDFSFADPKFLTWRQQLHQALVAEAQSLVPEAKPLRVLNLATASTFYDWPGETCVNDSVSLFPALATESVKTGSDGADAALANL